MSNHSSAHSSQSNRHHYVNQYNEANQGEGQNGNEAGSFGDVQQGHYQQQQQNPNQLRQQSHHSQQDRYDEQPQQYYHNEADQMNMVRQSNHSSQRTNDKQRVLSQQSKEGLGDRVSHNSGGVAVYQDIVNQNYEVKELGQRMEEMQLRDDGSQQEKENSNQQNEDELQGDIDLEFFDECYKAFLTKIAGDQEFVEASYEAKIDILMEFSRDEQMDFRLGSLIFLFELVYNFRESLTDSAVSQVLLNIYQNIPIYYEVKDFSTVYCALEIIALIGVHSVSLSNIKLIVSILIDEALPMLQDKAFLALVNLEYPGFFALIDIVNKDVNEVAGYVLNKLAQTEEIQLSVIVPSLLNDISMGEMKKRVASLAALNRMHSLIWKANALPLLVNLLNEGIVDRQLIVSTIRACGEVGEHTLLKILKQCKNDKIKMAIATVLSWRVANFQKSQLGVNIVPFNYQTGVGITPGTMCIYLGDQTPLAFVEVDENTPKQQDFIEINSRDFIAALQRLLAVKYDRYSQQQSTHDHDFTHRLSDFTLVKLIDPSSVAETEQSQTSQLTPISLSVIKALTGLLADGNHLVREAAVSSIGLVGLPEASQAIEQLYSSLKDPESQVRAMAAWCLGRIGEADRIKIGKRLISLLKDKFWKVRTAACVSLGSLGEQVQEIAFPVLSKILRDGSINKLTVCETLVRLGVYGEQMLIEMMKTTSQTDHKLKTAIIQAFELANVQRPTIDFVIEELFKNANDKMMEVRRACIETLDVLRNRAMDNPNITYLKARNVLPLFYYFLQDPSSEIAVESIQRFGAEAELMFIEGLTKDKNYVVRQECAKGLGSMGVQNFRALLFGLRDVHDGVRKATATAVKANFSSEQVIEEYQNKPNQLPALLCNIKDIFGLPFYQDEDCKDILVSILYAFGETDIPTNNAQNSIEQYSFEQHGQGQQAAGVNNQSHGSERNQAAEQSQKYKNVTSTQMAAHKVNKNVPNMRGGMPAYVFYQPGGGGGSSAVAAKQM